MHKRISRASKKLGLKPGSVIYVGRDRSEDAGIDIIDFSDVEHLAKRVASVEECFPYKDSPTMTWINFDGIHDAEKVEKLGRHFGLHELALEDIVNTGHRPTLDYTDDYILIVLKMLYRDKQDNTLISEQVSVAFSKNWVITFQETGEDVFDAVRKRIEKTVPRVKFLTSDYLAHALIDAVVDHYFIELERLGEEIEILDDDVSERPKPEHLDRIRDLKKKLIRVRKAVWPLREVIGGLERSDSKLIHEPTIPYLRDLYEHTIQVIDTVETYRDMVAGLLDLYHTGVSNHMNEIMKVLTIFATIFIPLGFLAGVYGMNFDTGISPFNLPELGMRFGYPFFWAIVISVAGSLLWYFRRKDWL
ncbi:MAG: magnesium/cobalt transporter CorA [Candidatus Zixiibacteriota bacterium]